jgi:hypothetical protein
LPSPVIPWAQSQPLTAKSLNLALYTSDGTADNTTGISFATWRPVLFEAYNAALTVHSSTGGTRTTLASSGAATSCWVVFDSAGYFGQSQDLPAFGYYQFTPAVLGSTGDGVTPGGWYLMAHFAPLTSTATQTSIGADLLQNGSFLSAGTRHQPTSVNHGTPFYLDLVNAGANTFAPAVFVDDSASANCAIVKNAADSSGETPRFLAIWAGISATSAGQAQFTAAGTYTWTAPAGVAAVSVKAAGAGGGGGAGNSATVITGGGAGGGGESAAYGGTGNIGVTPLNSYPVTVGGGGTGGAAAGANGSSGGASSFSGDTQSVTAHGGGFGAGATTTVSGTSGSGGTGSGAPTHFNGGAGAAGVTNKFGGGAGSSGGNFQRGNTAGGSPGAPAVPGGGPGGAGGQPVIQLVQTAIGSINGTNNLTVTMRSAFQAGNTVLVFLYYQGDGSSIPDPTVTLSDGTALSSQVAADVTSRVSLQVRLFDIYNITGGETSVIIGCHGTGNSDKGILAKVYEFAGLGTPTIDISSSHTQGPSNPDATYQASAGTPPGPVNTTKAPELWVAMTGAQQTQSFNIHNPPASQGWITDNPRFVTSTSGDIFGGMLANWQIRAAPGNMQFVNGNGFSRGVTKGTLVAAYVPGAATAGQSPPVGPGGGGGGGFGQNPGANGADGQVLLSWTPLANANYGTGPVPAPQPSWDDATAATAALVNGNTGITGVCNFLANPPVFRAHATTTQSIATSAAATVALGTVDADTYSGWNSSTGTYTVKQPGIYLAGALVPYAANGTAVRVAGISVNGIPYWGPASNAGTADLCNVAKTQMFSLNAGDTVQLVTWQNSGGALGTATSAQARMFLVWLCAQGAPPGLPGAPDPGFRWQSGTPGANLPNLMTQHLSQDLGFLVQRPYLLAYQSVAQSGLAQNAFATMVLDKAQGIAHLDAGDNYGGWTAGASNNYAAVIPGWYLACGEFFATSSGASGASVIGGIAASTSGGFSPSVTPDWYQHQTATANGSLGGAAAVFGLYYLNAGESLTPQLEAQSYTATFGTLTSSFAGGQVASHFEMCWISS